MGAIIGWVVGLFVSVGSAVGAALAAIYPILLTMWSALMSIFSTIAGVITQIGRHVYNFVRPVWTAVIKPVFQTLLDLWRKIKSLISYVLGPIIDALEWLNEHVLSFYNRFVAPVLQWLERARLILSGLGMLGLEWAKNLAGIIGQVEEQINRAFRELVGYINKVAQILDQLLAPEGWIRGQVFLASVQRWSGGAMSILIGIGIDPDLDLRVERTREEAEIPTLPSVRGDWYDLVLHSHPAVRAVVNDFREGRLRAGQISRPG